MTTKLESIDFLATTPKYSEYDAFDFYSLIPRGITLAIYGTGQRGEEFYHFLTHNRKDITIATFVDSFAKGSKFGLPVISPEELRHDETIDVVVICSLYSEQIIGILKYFGIQSYILFGTEPRFSKNFLKRNKKRLETFRNALQSDEDRKLLDLIVDFRKDYKNPIYNFQDFIRIRKDFGFKGDYLDHINMEAIKCVYDCGSYIGDSGWHFVQNLKNLESIYLFDAFCGKEEVQKHYPDLAEDSRAHFVNCGVSDKPSLKYGARQELFSAGASLSNKRCNLFNTPIRCTTIDIFSSTEGVLPPDLIKMDIENFEVRALNGALNTIKSRRLQYAISIYHSEQHLLEVYELLSQHCKNYAYNLAHYNNAHVNELILFAIPSELKR